MKVFISWSGNQSRAVAKALNDWISSVLQAVETFYSPEIEKGTKGIDEINTALEGTNFGILCLTRDNLESKWIHYEAGSLSKITGGRLYTFLLDLKPSDISLPLSQYQHTIFEKDEVYNLLSSVNSHLEKPLDPIKLKSIFDKWWSDLEDKLNEAKKLSDKPKEQKKPVRSDREVIDEILEIVRRPLVSTTSVVENKFDYVSDKVKEIKQVIFDLDGNDLLESGISKYDVDQKIKDIFKPNVLKKVTINEFINKLGTLEYKCIIDFNQSISHQIVDIVLNKFADDLITVLYNIHTK